MRARVLVPLFMLIATGCVYPIYVNGLRPEHPGPPDFEVDSLQPTLRWEPFPIVEIPPPDGLSDVTYEIKIFFVTQEDKVSIVYSREGITGPSHTLEVPLQPLTLYRWTVRARFKTYGSERHTQWSEYAGRDTAPEARPGPVPYIYRYHLRTPAALQQSQAK